MVLDERLDFQHFNERIGGACLNTVNTETNKQFTVCFNPALPNLSDNSIIHEMGHIIESSCQPDGDSYIFKTGLNLSRRGKNKEFGSFKVFDRYMMLDEILNDFYTMQVVREMQKDGFSVGLHPNSVSVYSMAFPFLNNFMIKYKDQLLDSKISTDPYRIYRYFSKEKVDALADACKVYFDECIKNEELTALLMHGLIRHDDALIAKIVKSQPQEANEIFVAMHNLIEAIDDISNDDEKEKDDMKKE